ncbi:MAG: hypoxanthine phosphoribosyltransferase [Thermoleophilia bacterium]|nr:hypoxanthine phosphoribosyltransferase [Thermoleophilia bacterium]
MITPDTPFAPFDDVLIDPERLKSRIRELGAEITRDYAGGNPLLIGVLKGSVFFMADLARAIDLPLEMDYMAVSSYGNATESSGVVRMLKDLDAPIQGRDVIIVEDIIDSGRTLSYLIELLQQRGPASIEICALLTKPERAEVDVDCRYVGFEIPNRFVVGYGLDYAERFRNLEYICCLDEANLPAIEPARTRKQVEEGHPA